MHLKPFATVRADYYEIAVLCKTSGEHVCLAKNGEGDFAVMGMEAFTRREKMLGCKFSAYFVLHRAHKVPVLK